MYLNEYFFYFLWWINVEFLRIPQGNKSCQGKVMPIAYNKVHPYFHWTKWQLKSNKKACSSLNSNNVHVYNGQTRGAEILSELIIHKT